MPGPDSDSELRAVLLGEHKGLARFRSNLKHLPADPRCKLCAAPFAGPGGAVLKHFGFGRRPGNPALCNNCIRQFSKTGATGAEIPVTLLFVDIRGSTALGERLTPTEFHDYLEEFYRIGSRAILDHDGLVDKLVGDEIIGLFFGGVSGPHQARPRPRRGDRTRVARGPADATTQGPIASAPRSTPGTPTSARPARRMRSRTSRPLATW